MVNVMRFIRQKKEQFANYRTQRQKEAIVRDTQQLELERARQAELAKVMKDKQKLQRDVDSIEDYNRKVRGPSRLQKFGEGAMRAMQTVGEAKKTAQSVGLFKPTKKRKKAVFGPPRERKGLNIGKTNKHDPFAPSGQSPFNK